MLPRDLTSRTPRDRRGPALLVATLLSAPVRAPWFGPGLDWSDDRADQYADRIGEIPSLYARRVAYPLGTADRTILEQLVEQAAPRARWL